MELFSNKIRCTFQLVSTYKYTDNKRYTFSTKSQQAKREVENHRHPFVNFSFGEWFVEKMLRGYEAVYKHITLTIHQINKFSSTSKPYVI